MPCLSNRKLGLYLALLVCVRVFSQAPSYILGNWLMFFNQTRISNNWSIHTEAQFRSFNITPNAEQILLRTGINYHIGKTSLATVGYGYITNYGFDKEQTPNVIAFENRFWEQFLFRKNLKRLNVEQRFRVEQRVLRANSNTTYLNRIRYLVRLTVPINKIVIEKNTLFLSFYDELFINLSSLPFDRNRLYGALGYQFCPNTSIQIGYLVQTTSVITKQYLQAALFYNLDFRKKPEEIKSIN